MSQSQPLPSVSAVLPVHNGAAFLRDAIDSVLAQTQPVLECIIVDDGSTDATAQVAAEFGSAVTYVHQRQAGVSTARNTGASISRGELIAFLDHDDLWLSTKLERQLEPFSDAGISMVMCALQVLNADGQVVAMRRLDPVEKLVTGMLLFDGTKTLSCSSTGVVRREAFEALGGFDPKLSMSADWDLLLRMLLQTHVAYVDEPLVLYRLHDSNMSRRTVTMEHDMRHAFEKAFRHPALPEALKQRRNEAYGRLYRMLAGSYRDHGELVRAARALAIGVGHHPRLLVELARHPPDLRASSSPTGAR